MTVLSKQADTPSFTIGASPQEDERPDFPWWPALLAAAGAALAGCQTIFDDDTFMHLAFGREIARRGWWLAGEPFLYTVPADRWSPENSQSWGMQVVFYAAYVLAGNAGIVGLQMLLVAAAAFAYVVYAWQRGASHWLAGMAAMAMASFAGFFLVHRPLLITPLLIVAMLLALNRITPRRLLLALFLQMLWVNLHASFVLGFIIFAARLAEEAWPCLKTSWQKRSMVFSPAARHLALAAALAPIVCLLNPAGWHIYRYIYELHKLDWLTLLINEWKPPEWDLSRFQYFGALLATAWLLCFLAFSWRRYLPLADILILGVLTYMALQARRFIVPAVFSAIAPTALAATALCPQRSRLRSLLAVLAGVAGVAFLTIRIESLAANGRLGFGVDRLRLPVGPVAWLKQNNVTGNVACAPTVGGYIEWACPEMKPATDGRCLANDAETVKAFNALANNQRGWQKAFPAAGVADVMVIENSYITNITAMRRDWAIVYWDETWEVILRRQSRYAPLVAQRDLTLSAPNMVAMLYDRLTPEEKREQARQLEDIVVGQSDLAVAYSCLGYVRYGQAMDALSELETAEEAAQEAKAGGRSEEAEAQAARGRELFRLAERKLREAIELYRRDAALMPRQSRSFFGAGRCLIWLGQNDEAYRCFAIAAVIDPLNWLHAINSTENRLAYLEAKFGKRAPIAEETRQLRERLRAAARDNRTRLLRVFQRMDRMAEAPTWLREE